MGLLLIDNQFLPQLKALIEGAKVSIDISTFKVEMTHKPRGSALLAFFNELIKKAKQGIKIRFLLNWNSDRRSVAMTNLFAASELKNNNIKVRHLRNNRCCHAKMVIVDRERAVVGSHNLSVKSCHNNFEISYLIPDSESVKNLSDTFSHSWLDAQKM